VAICETEICYESGAGAQYAAARTITPEPKYFANLRTASARLIKLTVAMHSKTEVGRHSELRRAKMGNSAPEVLQARMMKTEAMRKPIYSVEPPPAPHPSVAEVSVAAAALDMT
jgi:hypothetical protein